MTWDDINSYAYTDNHDVKDWGWEFIRRDDRYKAEWEEKRSKFKADSVLWDKMMQPDLSIYSDFNYADYENIMNSRPRTNLNLTNPDEVETFLILSHEDAKKWGLVSYQNPQSKKLHSFNKNKVKKLYLTESYFENFSAEISVPKEPNNLLVLLDLTKPILPQLNEIKERAQYLQKELKLNSKKGSVREKAEKVSHLDKTRWVKYLQCVDAKNANIKNNFAAKKIFVEPKGNRSADERWQETMRQIEEIKEKNYSLFMA